MAGHRPARVADAIRQEISQILREEIKDPRAREASVTRVEVTSDLGHARILVSVLGDEGQRQEAVAALQGAAGFIRRLLAPRLRLRSLPELRFRLDRGPEHSARMADLLADLVPADRDEGEETEEPSRNEDDHER